VAGRYSPLLLWLLVLGSLHGTRLPAASLALGIQTSPALITLNRELKYSLTLTNRSGGLLTNVVVNSTFNSAVDLVSTTNLAGTAALEGSAVVFRIPQLPNTSNAVMDLVVQPLSVGRLTNSFQLLALNINELTNTVNQVFAAEANLGISLGVDTNTLVTGDWTEFRLVVANAGPESASQIVVTNFLPAGAQFLTLTPSNPPVTVAGTQLVFAAGTLAPGSNTTYKVRLQANAAGTNMVSAQVSSPDLSDPVPGSDVASAVLRLENPQTGALSAAIVSAQTFNPQTGLMEQVIRLTNPTGSTVAGGRVVFPGISDQLFNAGGTNNHQPFVALTRALAAGESADLRIEYFIPTRTAIANPTIEVWGVPAYVPRPSPGAGLDGLRGHRLDTGGLLLEFPADPGSVYEVIYDDDISFNDPLRALPAIVAPGDRVQWIDEGPPKTRRRPDEAAARFYRLIKVDP